MEEGTNCQSVAISLLNPHFQTRRATTVDAPSIAKMIKGLAEYLGNAEKLKIGEKELLRDGFGNNPLFHCVVAEEIKEDHDGSDHEKNSFPEDVEGQGIGSSLMVAMAKIAKSRDCCRMQWVSPFSKRTMGFYRKLGASSMTDWTLFRMERNRIEELCSKQYKRENDEDHE